LTELFNKQRWYYRAKTVAVPGAFGTGAIISICSGCSLLLRHMPARKASAGHPLPSGSRRAAAIIAQMQQYNATVNASFAIRPYFWAYYIDT
jgi:hypothetical protein